MLSDSVAPEILRGGFVNRKNVQKKEMLFVRNTLNDWMFWIKPLSGPQLPLLVLFPPTDDIMLLAAIYI